MRDNATAKAWLERKPLDADTGLFNFSKAEREHIRDGKYADLSHCCALCHDIDLAVYGDDQLESYR